MLWLSEYPDGTTADITPKTGHPLYHVSVGASKYKLQIVVNGSNPLWPDQVPSYNYYSVGQHLNFTPSWKPSTPPYIAASSFFHWNLPGNYVNNLFTYYSYPCPGYSVNSVLLANETTSCWYVDKLDPGTVSIGMNLHFPNGQNVSIAAMGKFNIDRPKGVSPA